MPSSLVLLPRALLAGVPAVRLAASPPALHLLGLEGASACDLGRLDEGAVALVQAGRIFRELGDPRRICHSLGVLGWVLVEAGELREADDCAEGNRLIARRLRRAGTKRTGRRGVQASGDQR